VRKEGGSHFCHSKEESFVHLSNAGRSVRLKKGKKKLLIPAIKKGAMTFTCPGREEISRSEKERNEHDHLKTVLASHQGREAGSNMQRGKKVTLLSAEKKPFLY